jgi:hypothetical protein
MFGHKLKQHVIKLQHPKKASYWIEMWLYPKTVLDEKVERIFEYRSWVLKHRLS